MVESNPKTYILGVLIFGLLVFCGFYLLGLLNNSTGEFTDNAKYVEFNKSFNDYNKIVTPTSTLTDSLNDTEGGVLDTLVLSSWNSVKLVKSSFGFMDNVWRASALMFGIPIEVVQFIVLMIGVIIVFAIWSAIFQTNW